MAYLYLYLVVEGFQNLEEIDPTLVNAMRMLRTRISPQLFPAIVSPLFIIASIAKQGDEEFFRGVFSSPTLSEPKQRGYILPVLEEIWNKRRSEALFSWKDSLELSRGVLLV